MGFEISDYKNKDGQIKDPEIARKMAEREDFIRRNPEHNGGFIDKDGEFNQEKINKEIDPIGEALREKEERDTGSVLIEEKMRELIRFYFKNARAVESVDQREGFKETIDRACRDLRNSAIDDNKETNPDAVGYEGFTSEDYKKLADRLENQAKQDPSYIDAEKRQKIRKKIWKT